MTVVAPCTLSFDAEAVTTVTWNRTQSYRVGQPIIVAVHEETKIQGMNGVFRNIQPGIGRVAFGTDSGKPQRTVISVSVANA